MKIFFDSSAFAKRYIKEAGSEEIERYCSQATTLIMSSICLPEIISALCRLKRQSVLTEGQYRLAKQAFLKDVEDVSICNISPSVINRAVHILETSKVRTLDALHIACALELEADAFISSDSQQLSAAKAAGLKILKV
jgi:predicted nucleic acid-binding protein